METSRVLDKLRVRSRERAERQATGLGIGATYDAHAASLYRYLLTLLSDVEDAEDALQEVFLGLMRRGQQSEIQDLRAYLFRAAHNQALMVLRKRRRHEKETGAESLSWLDLGACTPEQSAIAVDIDRLLRELPVEQREVVALRLGEGLAFREIADVLGVPLGTAASRYRAALAHVREGLEEDKGDA